MAATKAARTKRRTTKAAKTTRQKTKDDWKCGTCGAMNPTAQVGCVRCGDPCADLTRAQRFVWDLLAPELDDHVAEYRERGVSDATLISLVVGVLQEHDTFSKSARWTTQGDVFVEISSDLALIGMWFECDAKPDRVPDLENEGLCRILRELYGLPSVKSANRGAGGRTPRSEISGIPTQLASVDVSDVDPSPYQPRKSFDEKSIAALAENIKRHGQTQACLVRRRGDRYELIGGERRWRACRVAGVPLLVRIADLTDEEAQQLALFDNLDREDLTDLEKVRSYRAMLDAGLYEKQKDLAADLGITAGALSNLLRVLTLPDDWLKLIEKGCLSVTEARRLVPYREEPAVLKLAKENIRRWEADNAINHAVRYGSRPLSGLGYSGRQWVTSRLTKKQQEDPELRVRTVDGRKRAFNIPLWEKYQAEGEARAAKSGAKEKKLAKTKTLTPAQRQARVRERAKVLAERIWKWKVCLMQRAVARELESRATPEQVLRIALWAAVSREAADREAPFEDVVGRHGKLKRHRHSVDGLLSLSATRDQYTELLGARCVAAWIRATRVATGPNEYGCWVAHRHITLLFSELELDLNTEFLRLEREELERFLQLHTKDQLGALALEWKLIRKPELESFLKKTTSAVHAAMLDAPGDRPCPKSVLKAKVVK